MKSFLSNNIDKIINSIGLIFDICGAIFVAWEVVKQFHGNKIVGGEIQCGGFPPTESSDLIKWEKNKYRKMKIGLTFLTIGFILQMLSNWIQYIID